MLQPRALAEEEQVPRRPGADLPAHADGAGDGHVPHRQEPAEGVRRGGSEEVETVRGPEQRRLHKAFLRYHDAENWPLLREALKRMGRADLIGPGKHHLVPDLAAGRHRARRRRRPPHGPEARRCRPSRPRACRCSSG